LSVRPSHLWKPPLPNCSLRRVCHFTSHKFFLIKFDTQGVWTLEELIRRVGPVDRTAALSAILTWIDLGVLKEETENTFRLLDKAEEAVPRVHMPRSRLGADTCTSRRTF
jgi:hypothetical protein